MRRLTKRPKQAGWKAQDPLRLAIVGWLIACWFIGSARPGADLSPFLKRAWPAAERFEAATTDVQRAIGTNGDILGYVATAVASGYGGPLQVAVAVSTTGEIESVAVVEHRETPTFFRMVIDGRFLRQLVDKDHEDPVVLGEDVDAVSGATYTCLGLTQAAQRAARSVIEEELGMHVPERDERIVFGLAEITLIVLFAIAAIQRRMRGKSRAVLRWIGLLGGLIVLGFVLNNQFVLAHVNMVLVGYWPEWQTHLFWYILIAGLLLFKAKREWNVYCWDFCPFGAVQEILAKVGGAKPRRVRWSSALLWSQRIITLAAISLALIYRNPGLTSFEIFGTAFRLQGSSYQFVLLALILVTSLFLYRPWCRYLCPLHKNTAEGLFDNIRRIGRTAWRKARSPRQTA